MNTLPWWRIGWRNLGRNRRRTLLTALGLAVGYTSVVVLTGLTNGIIDDMVENATSVITGQIAVQAPDYLPERSIYETIGGRDGVDLAPLLAALSNDPAVAAAAPRVYAGGLVSSGASTAGTLLLGIDVNREAATSRLLSALAEGRLPTAGAREVLIGRELAKQLDVAPGDELVLVAPAADGSLGNDLYSVSGIYSSGMSDLDNNYALLPIRTLQELVALDAGRVHEIALRVLDPWDAPDAAARLTTSVGPDAVSLDIRPWTTLRPELRDYATLAKSSMWILLVVVFAMAIFGVANTLLMATFERRREFALLLALGTTPRRIVAALLAEATALSLISVLVGVATSVPLIAWWRHAPLDLGSLMGDFTMAGALVRPVLRTSSPGGMYVLAAVALLATALLASLYPAFRATRVPPADTLAGR
jgi:ABC-type lipoprotein release transport system permease subunit